jgi:feruloyl esterase
MKLPTQLNRWGPRLPRLHMACALAVMATTGVAHAAYECASLTAVTTVDSTITAAAIVTPPATIGGVAVPVPMCRVQGVARPSSDSEIKFEVWLPPTANDWTGRRMKVNGTGGYAGSIPYARLAQDVSDGLVTAGSNMGHDGGESAAWTLNRPEKVKDWGLRAHFSVATAAKALSNAFYDNPVKYSYFEGCSNGGRQALMMAQNYPELFDGIVAGAPSNFYPDLLMWLLWTGKTLTPTFGGPPSVSTAQRQAVTARVLATCDAADGLVDGQITDPRKCRFDIDSMGPSGDGTLTADEVAVFKAMYAGTTSSTGVQRYTGARLGSEADWSPLFADNGGYGRFIGHFVYSVTSPPFDWRVDLNFDGDYDVVKQALTPSTAAPSPDLRAFVKRGGKVIQYHGWNDSVVTPDGSIGYFYALAEFERLQNLPKAVIDRQIEQLTPEMLAAHGEAFGPKVRQYHRLFMLPAVGHCGGSTGPNSFGGGTPEPPAAFRNAETHVVSAVMRWVEMGVAPEQIYVSRFAAGNLVRQRPVCPYPAQAAYNGFGNVDDASSFTCQTPVLRERNVGAGDLLHVQNALRQRDVRLPNR